MRTKEPEFDASSGDTFPYSYNASIIIGETMSKLFVAIILTITLAITGCVAVPSHSVSDTDYYFYGPSVSVVMPFMVQRCGWNGCGYYHNHPHFYTHDGITHPWHR